MSKPLPNDLAPFFWLHVKKAGGGTLRRLLAPDYVLAQRGQQPVNFIQSPRNQHNDILNNFRMPLGPYQFRRTAFAKTYLYPDCWDDLMRFAFVRNPLERCISAFAYLARPRGGQRSFVQHLQDHNAMPEKSDQAALFDAFLDLVAAARISKSIDQPVNLHFTTHTAPIWDDVSDAHGKLLLSHLFRLEDMTAALDMVWQACNLARALPADPSWINARATADFVPSQAQLRRVEQLYQRDFELYDGQKITRFSD